MSDTINIGGNTYPRDDRGATQADALLREAREAIDARDKLLVCYRLSKRPTEALFAQLEKTEGTKVAIDAMLKERER